MPSHPENPEPCDRPGARGHLRDPRPHSAPWVTGCPGGPAPLPAFRDCPPPPSRPSWFFSFGAGLGRPGRHPPGGRQPHQQPAGCAAASGGRPPPPEWAGPTGVEGEDGQGARWVPSSPPCISWHCKLSSSKSRQPTSPDRPLHSRQSPRPLAVPGPGTWALSPTGCHQEPPRAAPSQ